MMAFYSIISGILGAFLGIYPLSLDGHFVFLKKAAQTVYGNARFSIGNDVVFLIYLGIFVALFTLFFEKIINRFKTKNLKESAICLGFYIPALLISAFFENLIVTCIFLCLNIVVIYASDYVEKEKFNGKNSVYITALATFFGGLAGFSEVSLIFFAELLTGKRPKTAIQNAFILYTPIALLKATVYFIKSCIFGFTLNLGYSLIVFFISGILSVFLTVFLEKSAIKRDFRLYAYYLAFFAFIVIYTLMKG